MSKKFCPIFESYSIYINTNKTSLLYWTISVFDIFERLAMKFWKRCWCIFCRRLGRNLQKILNFSFLSFFLSIKFFSLFCSLFFLIFHLFLSVSVPACNSLSISLSLSPFSSIRRGGGLNWPNFTFLCLILF